MSIDISSHSEEDTANALIVLIEKQIEKFIHNLPLSQPLSESIAYVMRAGGKRIRPVLALSIVSECSADFENFLPVAVALEILHNASLVHDDLPALDNDRQRRGRNTCHVQFNEATAILTGDVLVPLAINLVTSTSYSADKQLKIISLISTAYRDLCYGQQLDILQGDSSKNIVAIAHLKTGALFSATFASAVCAIGGNAKSLELAQDIGLHLGLCYQICDDIADQMDTEAFKGRQNSSDRRNNKQTFFNIDESEMGSQDLLSKSMLHINENFKRLQKELSVTHDFQNTKGFLRRIFASFKNMETINI